MKHIVTVFTAFLISAMSYGQFQISGSSGFTLGSAQMKLEEAINISHTENDYGSHFKSSAKKIALT